MSRRIRSFLGDTDRGGSGTTIDPPVPKVAWLAILALPVAFLSATVLAHAAAGVPIGDITREPSVTLEGPPLTGIQSNLGILVWWSAASVCIFAWAVGAVPSGDDRRGFFLWAGLISALLGLDDLLVLHDEIFVTVLGQNERRTIVVYVAIVALFLWRYRRTILSSGGLSLLAGALAMLAVSALLDQLQSYWSDEESRVFVEDGLKLVGICLWSAYFIRRSFYAVRRAAPLRSTS